MTVCELHLFHAPRPMRTEDHHLIPRAWQRVWRPTGSGGTLWDHRTSTLCPTSHRNVHVILVRLMKIFGGIDKGIAEDERLAIAQGTLSLEIPWTRENKIARLSPHYWVAAGGSLQYLVDNGQYGYGLTDVPS